MKSKAWTEKFMQVIFAVAACASVLAVALICIFLFANGIPAMSKIGFGKFLTGELWRPKNDIYGIFPMIVGLVVLVPWVREIGRSLHRGGNGSSMITASILLGMMILPTIIGLTESALRAVPTQYYEGAVALGGTHERAIFTVVLPAAKSGVVAAIVLGIGRAIGETMAVIMVAGNQPRMPRGIFQGVRTLTANIVIEMGYASGLHREALIATGVVLFVFILLLNFCVALLNRGKNHE